MYKRLVWPEGYGFRKKSTFIGVPPNFSKPFCFKIDYAIVMKRYRDFPSVSGLFNQSQLLIFIAIHRINWISDTKATWPTFFECWGLDKGNPTSVSVRS